MSTSNKAKFLHCLCTYSTGCESLFVCVLQTFVNNECEAKQSDKEIQTIKLNGKHAWYIQFYLKWKNCLLKLII